MIHPKLVRNLFLLASCAKTMAFLAPARGFTSTALDVSVKSVLADPKWPEKWPFSPKDFAYNWVSTDKRADLIYSRQDESKDTYFYNQPRLVYHIDDGAVNALSKYYKEVFFDGATVLDICSSWVSHFPKDVKLGRTVGLGMNEFELSKNQQLKEFVVQVMRTCHFWRLPILSAIGP